ncbi:23194_t:CDS:2 [Gigaspora margarita]|uniref:23194_t:CDS:1 n=1 Tax=Gigaspora margarita TaxID=4874 RepID=A0ABN7WDB2_GIGMA|nr:23194_t:CDS:2 [Gigaspora margarita]
MSDNLFPSVEEVQKWSPGKVIDFLKHKQDDLFLKDKHIEVIEDQEVAGRDFLELNVEKLTKYGLKGGPAERIEGLTRDIKSEGQDTDVKDQKIKELEQKLISLQQEKIATSSSSATKRHFFEVDNYEKEQEKNVKRIQSYLPPSSFALLGNLIKYHVKDKQLLIHRPPECVGPPVQAYHDVFNQFLRDYHNEDLEMGKEHYQWTLGFIHEMANIYSSKHERSKIFRERFQQLFGEELKIIRLDDESSNDGVLECNFHSFSVLRLLVEIKNEIGTGKCDPTTQAGTSYAKYYTQEKNEKLIKWCNWPSFILCLAGPWVCILGAVYVEKPIVDPLTDFIPLIPTNIRDHAERVARLFKALCLGVNRLKEYYGSIVNPQNSQRFFPYPNQYNHQGTVIEFTYEKKLVDQPDKLLWKAITKDGKKIVVKFTWRYNQRAHKLCNEIGKAPKLLHISKEVVDGFYMVVMDYVKAKPLYNCSNSLSHDECKTVFEDIEEAISKLHKQNIVFADLRDSNILVNKSQGQCQGMLIDFDWVGEEGIECYPSFMNHEFINWPPGAEDKKQLSREHDTHWLKLLKSKYLDESSND